MSQVIAPKDLISKSSIYDPLRGAGVIPKIQSVATINFDEYITIPMTPVAPTSSIYNGTIVYFDLQANICNHIENLVLVLNVTFNSSVTTLPSPFWFKCIRIHENKGSGEYLKYMYPDEMLANMAYLSKEDRNFYERNGCVRFIECEDDIVATYPLPANSGETKNIYIPLSTCFWNFGAFHMQHIRQDIRFELEFNSDFVISGTASDVILNSVSFLIREHNLPEDETRDWVNEFRSQPHYYNYLDTTKVTLNTNTLTAGSQTNFDVLQNLTTKSPLILFCVKPSTTPSASDQSVFRPVVLGNSATIDMLSPSLKSLLGNGNAITITYLNKEFIRTTGKKPIRGYYLLPFTEDIQMAWNGIINGYFPFCGEKNYLAIKLGDAGTSEVHTFTSTGTVNAGVWHFYYDGEYIAQTAYNGATTGAGSSKVNLEASDKFKAMGWTVTVSAAMDQASITFTFNNGAGSPSRDNRNRPLNVIAQKGNAGEITPTITTRGIRGFNTGSNYQMEIYAYYYRRLEVTTMGTLNTVTL